MGMAGSFDLSVSRSMGEAEPNAATRIRKRLQTYAE
jgi:hypothetical protein